MTRVVSKLELANRVGLSYDKLAYILRTLDIKPTLKLPYSGGRGFSPDQAQAIMEQMGCATET